MADRPSGNDDTAERLDATGEFFSVGTPLHAVRAGYIRRRADDLLYEAAVAGRYAHIIAPDRSGKSSLIAATAARLENNGVNVAILDLEQIGVRDGAQDAGRWYYNVAYRLMRQLRVRYDLQAWWQDKSVLSNRQRLVEFYAEVILQNVQQRIVVFVDEIQSVATLPFADQLLASIRSAHNSRTTDPDFTRLTFVLLGECDPLSLVLEPEMSPFVATQPVPLDDFSREDLDLFATELNLDTQSAERALDRIFHWTRGQPYLTQKLARAVARETVNEEIEDVIDRIVAQQLTGRAALHSEPHLSHIHRELVGSGRQCEALLNLYGKLRKGIRVPADLGSAEQRRLMAVGLLEIDDAGELTIRNRVYEAVFTARWANENLPTRWRAPVVAIAAMLLLAAIPFWYTQWLPSSYVRVLTSPDTTLPAAESTWRNFRSFPGHTASADGLLRSYLHERASVADSVERIAAISALAGELPDAGMLPETLQAEFWDRRTLEAMRGERRDEALLASLEALVLSTSVRRIRSSMLVADDYPLLLASSSRDDSLPFVFDADNLLLTAADGSQVSQWTLAPDGLSRVEDWTITALEVSPLVRRIIVDREGTLSRVGLTLNISHPRLADLRIKVIAPSGKTVEVDTGRERASSNDDIRVPPEQLRALIGESLPGTWSISLRDEATGVAGHLVGWNLTLNSQGLVEDFQRGLGIPDPVERETDQFWISGDGRYAIARATQSDSARLWDLAFAKPVVAIAASENERLIGIDAGARRIVTATLDSVHLWDTASGKRAATLPAGIASATSALTADGRHLFVQQRGDLETRFALWSLDTAALSAELVVAGTPALVAVDAAGTRLAIADFDRAVRVWDLASGEMATQFDLPLQPSRIDMNASGDVIAAIYGSDGVTVWPIDEPRVPLYESFEQGRWQLRFSASGSRFMAGTPRAGFQLFDTYSGRRVGPAVGAGGRRAGGDLLGFSRNEDIVVTSGPDGNVRFWQMPVVTLAAETAPGAHPVWSPAGDAVVVALPDASALALGDRLGHVHVLAATNGGDGLVGETEDVSFLGHNAPVRLLAASADGGLLASVGADNTVRVWHAGDGQPRDFIATMPGSRVEHIVFSKDATLLGLLAGSRAAIMDTASGEFIAELELSETHLSMAFGADRQLFLGSQTGLLNVIARDPAGAWNVRRIWAGESALRRLEVSGNGRYLVVVDDARRAALINLGTGQPGELTLQLPDAVEDVAFSPGGSRVLLRTARWVHRVGASSTGLMWLDALFVPKPLAGSRIVFGGATQRGREAASIFYLPVSRDGIAQLSEFHFSDSNGAGLFGNREQLIADWRRRLAYDTEVED